MKFNQFFQYSFSILFLFGSHLIYSQETNLRSEFDFSEIDFANDTSVTLTGEWEFYWDTLLEPDDGSLNYSLEYLPEFWKNYGVNEYSATGYATFKTRVKLSRDRPILALQLGDIHNSYNLFVNEKLVRRVGIVTKSIEGSVPKWVPQFVVLDDTSEILEITLQVSNFHHRNGGVQHAIVLGNVDYLLSVKESISLADLLLGGSCMVIGLFFFGMYFFYKKDKSTIYFGLFCFLFAVRVLIVGSRSLLIIMPWLPWQIAIRIEYLTLFLSVIFFLYFIYFSFKEQTSRLLVQLISFIYLLIITGTILLPASIFTYFVIPNNTLLLGLITYSLMVYLKAFRRKVFGAGWAILSLAVLLVAVGLELAEYANLFIPSPILVSSAFLAFVFTMSLIFASRFGKAFSDVESLKIDAEIQNDKISEQHDLIKDSIHYSKRIQRALLPSKKAIQEKLPNSVIYYNPQSVVSGDFYWYKYIEKSNDVILAISDCTGHGVPGAFMSIVGISSLDKIVSTKPNYRPSQILEQLNSEIRLKLNSDIDEQVQEGMDIIICRISLDTNSIEFSSALHKMVLVRNGKATIFSGCRHFIGSHFKKGFKFIEHKLALKTDDQIFMFSDGIYDQKGGNNGKKLYLKGFEEILIQMANIPVSEQENYLSSKINSWQGASEQLDDMLVFGWKVK